MLRIGWLYLLSLKNIIILLKHNYSVVPVEWKANNFRITFYELKLNRWCDVAAQSSDTFFISHFNSYRSKSKASFIPEEIDVQT